MVRSEIAEPKVEGVCLDMSKFIETPEKCPDCGGRKYHNTRLLGMFPDGSIVYFCNACMISFDASGKVLKRLTEKEKLRVAQKEEYIPWKDKSTPGEIR